MRAPRDRFQGALIPLVERQTLHDGQQTFLHEDKHLKNSFTIEFTPSGNPDDCRRWFEALTDVSHRSAGVETRSISFKFTPKELDKATRVSRTPSPIEDPEIAATSIGLHFIPDDHQNGAILFDYSPSRQLELHGIPLDSALVHINSLSVVHMPHWQVMEALEFATRNARKKPREEERELVLEFCSLENYYWYGNVDAPVYLHRKCSPLTFC